MYTLRVLTAADLDMVCRHREQMFREAGSAEEKLAGMAQPFREWLQERLSDGRYFGFAAETGGGTIGAVGLMVLEWPPHPRHPHDDRRGYVLNVYVDSDHRGRGVARALMDEADAEFRRRGISYAILHATQAGRPLYERSGWVGTSEMAKAL